MRRAVAIRVDGAEVGRDADGEAGFARCSAAGDDAGRQGGARQHLWMCEY